MSLAQPTQNAGLGSPPKPMFDATASKLLRALDGFQFTRDAWPDQRDTEGEKEPGEVIRETREKCERLWRERGPEAWPILEQQVDRLTRQIEEAEARRAELGGDENEEARRRVIFAGLIFVSKRIAVRRFLRSHDPLDVPEPANDEAPVIEGRHAPEYALEARDVLNEHPAISSFSKLAAQMEPGGGSKKDTLKRATGYNDLPRAEKDFARFKELLLAGAARLED